jgi:hypothetical protein
MVSHSHHARTVAGAAFATKDDILGLSAQLKVMMTAVDVRLTSWHDPSRSFVEKVSCYADLRSVVGDGPKLYFFDERTGNPRGTVRVKVIDDDVFAVLRQQPADARPITVYFYTQTDNDTDSSPQGRPRALATADSSTSSSSRSTAVQAVFRTNVERRYSINGDAVVCLLCGKAEGELCFEACHIIPYSCTEATFTKYHLLGGKTDPLNGVFFCHECHQFHDNGHWNWEIEEHEDHLAATVVVSEGLQGEHPRWGDFVNKIVHLGKGPTYPSREVWDAGHRLNFSEPHQARVRRRTEKGPRCIRCGHFYKRDYQVHDCPTKRRLLLHTPRAEHAPRSGRGGRGRAGARRGGKGNAGGGRAPPVMPSLRDASLEHGDTTASRKSNFSKGQQPTRTKRASVAGTKGSDPAKSRGSKTTGDGPKGSRSRDRAPKP